MAVATAIALSVTLAGNLPTARAQTTPTASLSIPTQAGVVLENGIHYVEEGTFLNIEVNADIAFDATNPQRVRYVLSPVSGHSFITGGTGSTRDVCPANSEGGCAGSFSMDGMNLVATNNALSGDTSFLYTVRVFDMDGDDDGERFRLHIESETSTTTTTFNTDATSMAGGADNPIFAIGTPPTTPVISVSIPTQTGVVLENGIHYVREGTNLQVRYISTAAISSNISLTAILVPPSVGSFVTGGSGNDRDVCFSDPCLADYTLNTGRGIARVLEATITVASADFSGTPPSATVRTVNIISDSANDDGEQFRLGFATPAAGANYALAPAAAFGAATGFARLPLFEVGVPPSERPSTLTIRASASSLNEGGSGNLVLSRTGGDTSQAITVNLAVSGSATLGTDYTIAGGTMPRIPAGQTSRNIPIAIGDDSAQEGAENIVVTLRSGTGYVIGSPSSTTITIPANDSSTGGGTGGGTPGGPMLTPFVDLTPRPLAPIIVDPPGEVPETIRGTDAVIRPSQSSRVEQAGTNLVIPIGAYTDAFYGVQVTTATAPTAQSGQSLPSGTELTAGGAVRDITFRTDDGEELTRLLQPVQVCFAVTPAQIADAGGADFLRIARFHAGIGWDVLNTSYDFFANEICAYSLLFGSGGAFAVANQALIPPASCPYPIASWCRIY